MYLNDPCLNVKKHVKADALAPEYHKIYYQNTHIIFYCSQHWPAVSQATTQRVVHIYLATLNIYEFYRFDGCICIRLSRDLNVKNMLIYKYCYIYD